MTEAGKGFELISGPRGGRPGAVEDLLRLENPSEAVEKLQDWMVGAFNAEPELVTDLGGTTHGRRGWGKSRLPERLDRDSFPVLLTTTTSIAYKGPNNMSQLIAYLDFIQPNDRCNKALPLLVARVQMQNASIGSGENRRNRQVITGGSLFESKGWERLLAMGLPLDVALWQHRDHPKFSPPTRLDHLMGMKPIVYINGQSQMETATEDELLKLPGVIMRVNGVTRFYVADPEYQIQYTEE